ncbi:Uncharacterised protein [Bordetella pertussis]|nr:Uncharacterised protein [Bordetella pertussis]
MVPAACAMCSTGSCGEPHSTTGAPRAAAAHNVLRKVMAGRRPRSRPARPGMGLTPYSARPGRTQSVRAAIVGRTQAAAELQVETGPGRPRMQASKSACSRSRSPTLAAFA